MVVMVTFALAISSGTLVALGAYVVFHSWAGGFQPLLLWIGPGVGFCQDSFPCWWGRDGAEPEEGILAQGTRLGPCCLPGILRSLKSEMKSMKLRASLQWRLSHEGFPAGGGWVVYNALPLAAWQNALLS